MTLDETLNNIHDIVESVADADLAHNNANKASEQIPVMRDMVAGEISKYLGLSQILPEEISKAHTEGRIHYHK